MHREDTYVGRPVTILQKDESLEGVNHGGQMVEKEPLVQPEKVNDEEIVADRELMADNFQDANNMINKEVTNGDFMIECNHETGTEPSRETQGLNQVVEVDSIGPDEMRSKELSGQKAQNMEDCMFLGLNREIEAHLEEADLMYPPGFEPTLSEGPQSQSHEALYSTQLEETIPETPVYTPQDA